MANEPLALMLTTDRQIDRRTLLIANSMELAGLSVVIVALPLDIETPETDSRVLRIQTRQSNLKTKNLSLLLLSKWLRRHLAMNGNLMRFLKRATWSYIVKQEPFYRSLFSHAISQYNPQFVVAVDLPTLPSATEVASRCRAKLIYDSHELYCEQEFSRREKRAWKTIEEKYIGACDVVITVNPSIAAELEQRYSLSEVKVIYNAENCEHTPKKTGLLHEVFNLAANKKIILFQGGLSAGRNLDVVVQAMSYLNNPNINLVVLGDGPLRFALERRAAAKGLAHRIHFHAAVPQQDLLKFTEAADAGLIPYQANCLNNYYCTPNKLFEFIAAGLPILASQLPEIENLVLGQQIGMVGDMSRPQSLAQLIDEFFSNEARLRSWQDNTLEARKHICWKTEEQKILTILESLR